MTFLLELREAAKADRDARRRKEIRKHADAIEKLAGMLNRAPEHSTLTALNCAWARSVRLLDESDKFGGGPPAGAGGKMKETAALGA